MGNQRVNISATKAIDYKQLKLSSADFQPEGLIPPKHTCDGANISPSLTIEHVPDETKCLAIVVDDPDAPSGNWVHWLVWNIPVTHHIKENEVHGVLGLNDFKRNAYGGPCPPAGTTHRYFFKVYALDSLLDLAAGATKIELGRVMSDHIIGFGELIGLYKKNS
jgi:Raf kinase inhibitor-like YbhB/YbcL family protein